jgi:hypothetical protein
MHSLDLSPLARRSYLQNHCLKCPCQHCWLSLCLPSLYPYRSSPLCLGQLFTLAAAALATETRICLAEEMSYVTCANRGQYR